MKESVAAGLVLTVLLFAMSWLHAAQTLSDQAEAEAAMKEVEPAAAEVTEAGLHDSEISLRVKVDGTVQTMTMAAYLPGVVRGEMLPGFDVEALKAQAVAERTYICYQMEMGGKAAHPDADVCDDPGCCNAYLSEEAARQKWGDAFDRCEAKIQASVTETDGTIMLYAGAPIMAVFHSSSAGRTAACGDVWSADLPYLVSVESPEEAASVPNYYSVKTVSRDEFRQTFTAAYPRADFSGTWVTGRTENDSGRVDSITVGGITVSGSEMRSLYGLRSTCFTVEVGDEVVFRVTGYGHGVGMSQYGAAELAKQGKTWQEILQWYYTDITLGSYTKS